MPSRFSLCLAITFATAAQAWEDVDAFQRLLDAHVKPGTVNGVPINVVNYMGIAADRTDLDQYLKSLAEITPKELEKASFFERKALAYNSYNAFSMNTMINHACNYDDAGECLGPVHGIVNIMVNASNGFNIVENNVAGTMYSLNMWEGLMHPVPSLPLFKPDEPLDLRAHPALVCGGTSCPNVPLEAFVADRVDEQLTHVTTEWMAHPYKGLRLDPANNKLHLSHIMGWFKSEFDAQGGFEKVYAPYFNEETTAFIAKGGYEIVYMGYMWDANGPNVCTCIPTGARAAALADIHCDIKFPQGNPRVMDTGSWRN